MSTCAMAGITQVVDRIWASSLEVGIGLPLNFSGVVPDDVHITQEWLIMRGHLEIVKRRPFCKNLHPDLREYGLLAGLAKSFEQEHSAAFQQRV
jgi:hypothetical protein